MLCRRCPVRSSLRQRCWVSSDVWQWLQQRQRQWKRQWQQRACGRLLSAPQVFPFGEGPVGDGPMLAKQLQHCLNHVGRRAARDHRLLAALSDEWNSWEPLADAHGVGVGHLAVVKGYLKKRGIEVRNDGPAKSGEAAEPQSG